MEEGYLTITLADSQNYSTIIPSTKYKWAQLFSRLGGFCLIVGSINEITEPQNSFKCV